MEQIKDSLNKIMDTIGGAENHIEYGLENGRILVSSLYAVGVKPSHKILDELYEWAEENNRTDIVNKIEELTEKEGAL